MSNIQIYDKSQSIRRIEKLGKAGSLYPDLGKILTQHILDVQIRNEVPTQQLERIVEFIFKQYPDFSIDDIEEAFFLAITPDNLPCDPRDLQHYGELTPRYVGNVLSAYRKHRQENRRRERMNQKPF